MIQITFPDGSARSYEQGVTGLQIADAFLTGYKSGVWSVLIGVGTAMIWNFASRSRVSSDVKSTVVSRMASSPTSMVGSIPL